MHMHAMKERSDRVSSLVKQVEFLQQQFDFISSQKSELESQLKNKSQEASECCIQMEKTRAKLTNQALNGQKLTEGEA